MDSPTLYDPQFLLMRNIALYIMLCVPFRYFFNQFVISSGLWQVLALIGVSFLLHGTVLRRDTGYFGGPKTCSSLVEAVVFFWTAYLVYTDRHETASIVGNVALILGAVKHLETRLL